MGKSKMIAFTGFGTKPRSYVLLTYECLLSDMEIVLQDQGHRRPRTVPGMKPGLQRLPTVARSQYITLHS
jgi:hypothetical protein